MIVTIAREIGAGGGEVARRVAERLGWRLVDHELIDQIAARSGLSPAEVAARDERAPGFVERLIRMLTKAAPEIFPAPSEQVPELEEATLVRVTEDAVAELARTGRVVLVGRAAPAVLKTDPDALHFKIVAPLADRIEAVRGRSGLDPDEAAAEVARSDANRARYHRQHYGRDWTDASLYHLVLNTGALGREVVVALIVDRARATWPQATAG